MNMDTGGWGLVFDLFIRVAENSQEERQEVYRREDISASSQALVESIIARGMTSGDEPDSLILLGLKEM